MVIEVDRLRLLAYAVAREIGCDGDDACVDIIHDALQKVDERRYGFEHAVGDFGQGPLDDECPRPEVGSWTEANRLVVEGRT